MSKSEHFVFAGALGEVSELDSYSAVCRGSMFCGLSYALPATGENQRNAETWSGAKKDPQNQKIARTAPNNFLNNSRGLLALTQ